MHYECEDCGWPWPLADYAPGGAECDNCGGEMVEAADSGRRSDMGMPLKFTHTAENEWRDEQGRYRLWRNEHTGNVFVYRTHPERIDTLVNARYTLKDAMALADADAAFADAHRKSEERT